MYKNVWVVNLDILNDLDLKIKFNEFVFIIIQHLLTKLQKHVDNNVLTHCLN